MMHSAGWLPLLRPLLYFYLFIFKCLFTFERERERERAPKWGRSRGKGTEDPKQALCWQQSAWPKARTHEPWDHVLSWSLTLNRLSHPGAPETTVLKPWMEAREDGFLASSIRILNEFVAPTEHRDNEKLGSLLIFCYFEGKLTDFFMSWSARQHV